MKGSFNCRNMDYRIGLTENEIKALNRGEEVSGLILYTKGGKSIHHFITIIFKPKPEVISMKSNLLSRKVNYMAGPHVMVIRQNKEHFVYYIIEEIPDIEELLLSENPTAQLENRYDSHLMNKIFLYHEE
jgi:hypothetical protein